MCPDAYVEAAKRAAGGLARYENAAALGGVVAQGAEPRDLRDPLSLPEGFEAQENRAYDADYAVRQPSRTWGANVGSWCWIRHFAVRHSRLWQEIAG